MRHIFFSHSFLIPAFAFVIHQILTLLVQYPLPFLDAYLDPFCFSVIMLHLVVLEKKRLGLVQELSLEEVFGLLVSLSIISELIFPWVSQHFTGDWYDVISIVLGGVWFVWIPKRFRVKAKKNVVFQQ